MLEYSEPSSFETPPLAAPQDEGVEGLRVSLKFFSFTSADPFALILRRPKGPSRRIIRGSHHKFRNAKTRRMVILTHPRKDIPLGTVKSIYDQAGWTKD